MGSTSSRSLYMRIVDENVARPSSSPTYHSLRSDAGTLASLIPDKSNRSFSKRNRRSVTASASPGTRKMPGRSVND